MSDRNAGAHDGIQQPTRMLTAGVDLAAEPKGTAVAVIEWSAQGATLTELTAAADDDTLIEVAMRVDKFGIDCALGWPISFIDFINQQTEIKSSPVFDGGIAWRRGLAYRETDRRIRQLTGRWPLSVSTDRLGLTAMRASALLTKIREAGIEVDRSGARRVVEIYPGASLRIWGFDTKGYRTSFEKREALFSEIQSAAPWLDLNGHEEQMLDSCDSFDAVVAALSSRAAAIGATHSLEPELVDIAKIEGWIALPSEPIGHLLDALKLAPAKENE